MSRVDREGPVHRAILAHLRKRFPSAIIHHSANEIGLSGKNVARAIAKAKFNGMVPGFPDLACFLGGGFAVFFEVKAEGGYPTEAQKSVIDRLQFLGFRAAVVRSVAEVDEWLEVWGIAHLRFDWAPNDYTELHRRIVGGADL